MGGYYYTLVGYTMYLLYLTIRANLYIHLNTHTCAAGSGCVGAVACV